MGGVDETYSCGELLSPPLVLILVELAENVVLAGLETGGHVVVVAARPRRPRRVHVEDELRRRRD